MRLNVSVITAVICLSLAGCAGCGAVPIAKPWNGGNGISKDSCAASDAKSTGKDHCPSPSQNPDF